MKQCEQTKTARLRKLLKREWVTPMTAAAKLHCYSLSQRCGEFRQAGEKVIDKRVVGETGNRCKAYRIQPARG